MIYASILHYLVAVLHLRYLVNTTISAKSTLHLRETCKQ